MIRIFFKVAFRNLIRKQGFSFINIMGLAVGMASASLILLWIQNEVSYDQFHQKKDRIYEVWNRGIVSAKLESWSNTPKVLARTLERDFPEVEQAIRVNWSNSHLFRVGDKQLMVAGSMVDPDFLRVFSFRLVKGNPASALNDRQAIVLTEKLAKKLFGSEEAMGKVIKLDNKDNFTVTGIVKDLPNNTRFNFEYLLPWSSLLPASAEDTDWSNYSTSTFVLLKPNTTLAAIAPKIKTLRKNYAKDDLRTEMFLYPISRWRLYSQFANGAEDGGRIEVVRLFGIIAVFILLIACINFMNLSTAQSEKRAKEVGIRKVVGAHKKTLIGQFIGESVLLSFIAGMVALLMVIVSLPAFNELTHKNLFINFRHPSSWLAALGFIFFTGLIAGSYPAFFLSSFQPIKVLKGTFRAANTPISPRRVLVVLQFTFATVLIISTIIIKQQIDHAQNRQNGYDKNNLLYHFLTGDLNKNYALVKNELLASGVATSVSKTSSPITQNWSSTWDITWQGKDPTDKTLFDRFKADDKLVETVGLQLVQGRDFDLTKFPTDSTAIILNESAVKAMNLKEPIGQILKDTDIDWHVIGVIKDIINTSPYQSTFPMVIEGAKGFNFSTVHIKLNNTASTAHSLQAIEAIFKKYNPHYPFEYHFVEEEYAWKFDDEKRTGILATLFAGLTIFISCLGLFGLATYTAENRKKEIGVRKVLGASVASITTLLCSDFIKLVFVSILLATPVAWFGMYQWLQNYPYRVDIQGWVFAVAGMASVFIAIISVSYQAIKAAVANPVESLRNE